MNEDVTAGEVGSVLARSVGPKIENLKRQVKSVLEELERLDVEDPSVANFDLPSEMRRYEIELIRAALHATGNHQKRAARMLGINATTLNSKIKRLSIAS